MNKFRSSTFISILVFSLLLSACSSAAPQILVVTVEIPHEVTSVVQQTVLVTQIVEKVVTATPVPPSPTPEISATPIFQKWTTSQVAQAFKDAGLEYQDPKLMTKVDYGISPMSATEGIHFLVPSVCSDCGGRIFSFATEQDLKISQTYYENLGKNSAAFFSWVFVKDNILVQINGDLPEDKAKLYQNALDSLK